jgi:hypothetical protein
MSILSVCKVIVWRKQCQGINQKNHLATLLYQKMTYLCSILLLIHKILHIMAKKNNKHSFILEMGVYMLFLFLFSILFNLFGYNENTFESNLSILVYYFVLNLCTIVAVTLVMGFIANRKKENN